MRIRALVDSGKKVLFDEFIDAYGGELVSAGLTIVISFIVWLFMPRVKLMWGKSHGFNHGVSNKNAEKEKERNGKILVSTASHLIMNAGRKAATNVELTFNFPPDTFEVWPQRDYTTNVSPDDRFIVKFKSLSPKEEISANILMLNVNTPNLLSVRCDENVGKSINLWTLRKYSRLIEYCVGALLFLGATGAIYILIQLVGWFATLAKI